MAAGDPISGTEVTSTMVGIREDLTDTITRIDPTEVPFYSNARKGTAPAIRHDWQIQELRAPNRANANKEGFDATFTSKTPTVRLENVCQLMNDTWIVSDTADAVNTAGRAKESAYKQLLTGLEVRRDVESVLVNNQALNFASEPRLMAGFPAMCGIQNTAQSGGMVSTNAVGSAALTIGTLRDLSLSLIDDCLEVAYNNGSVPKDIMMPPRMKRAFSYLHPTNLPAQNMAMQTQSEESVYVGTVGIYLSDFGRVETGMNRFMLSGMIFILDWDYISVLTLAGRSFKNTPLAKTGSATKGMIEWEGTLEVRAPKGEAVLAAVQPPAAGVDVSGTVNSSPIA